MDKYIETLVKASHWVIRIPLISIFFLHSFVKFTTGDKMALMMNMDKEVLYIVAIFELVAAVLLFLGGAFKRLDWATRLASVIYLVIILGSLKMVSWGQWAFMPANVNPWEGVQYQMILVCSAIYFLIVGNTTNRAESL